ncbi:MAG TPA: right-handed parallel beta-helix repeat-containing protein [Candidatus Eisenbacteria bacterium]|nr:right-handed parallel beta-helix repeat-containing protein [Candidatus Eisenbacteria bacterium]
MRSVPAILRRGRPRPIALAAMASIFLVCSLAPESAQAKRIFVPRQHKRLQSAIDAAAAGDTVWVAAGTYPGPFVLKKPLVLFGEGGPSETILDGRDSVRVLHVEGVTRGAIYGFRIQHGRAAGGGGIYCLRDTAFAIGSCDVRLNREAGVAVWQSSLIQISDSEISQNKGGGLTASDSRLQLVQVNLRDNHAPTGGGMSLVSSDLTIARNCLFEGNRADDGTGGGLFAEDSSSVDFLNCTFRGNSAAAGGGAVAVMDRSSMRIRSSRFTANRSSTGGAVLTDRSWVDIQISIFSRNRATAAGAAVQILGRRTAGVNPMIVNNTFYRNGVDSEGGAIYAQEVSPDIVRNIFVVDSTAKNKTVIELKGAPRYECNLIYAMDGPGARPSANTIVGNPSFCDAENGDFRVRDLSPALLAPCGRLGALGKGCPSFRMLPSK